VTAYLERVCGADRAGRLTPQVLAAVAQEIEPGMAAAEAASVARRAVRAVAFGQLDRAARSLRRRLERAWAGHRRCAATPRLLHERAAGEISQPRVDRLYGHLDHCDHCAALAGRCDLAEWHLAVALAVPGQASTNGTPPPGRRPPLPSSATVERPAASPAFALWQETPDAPPAPRRRLVRRPVVVALVAFTVLGGAAAGAILLRGGGRVSARRPSPPPPAPGPVVHGLRGPFVVGGARFAVFRDPQQGWTSFRRRSPGAGKVWMAVTVLVRNFSLADFDPRALTYRVFDGAGTAYAPDRRIGTAPAQARPPRPLAAGQLAEARLGFRIDPGAPGLQLRFSPVPGGPPVVVSLQP
jgi:hypothetical protein